MSELDSTYHLDPVGSETPVSAAAPTTAATSSSLKRYITIFSAAVVTVVIVIVGLSRRTDISTSATHLRGLLERTIQGDAIPVPFWIIRQDVPEAYKVQNAFFNFPYLKSKKATLREPDGAGVEVTFFENIKRTNADGTSTTLGYFNPVSPQGLPSNIFNFEYGDKCEATKDYTEGFLELICGQELSVVSISELKPCKYKIVATTPERCSAHEIHHYLEATSADAFDGQWWNYKINFFKHEGSQSHVYAFHKDARSHERILLGIIEPTVDSNKDLHFSNGDLHTLTKKRRSGIIHMECGCKYAIKKLTEKTAGVYEAIVTHPEACVAEPQHCDSASLEQSLFLNKEVTMLSQKPEYQTLGSFPRDLLHPKH